MAGKRVNFSSIFWPAPHIYCKVKQNNIFRKRRLREKKSFHGCKMNWIENTVPKRATQNMQKWNKIRSKYANRNIQRRKTFVQKKYTKTTLFRCWICKLVQIGFICSLESKLNAWKPAKKGWRIRDSTRFPFKCLELETELGAISRFGGFLLCYEVWLSDLQSPQWVERSRLSK